MTGEEFHGTGNWYLEGFFDSRMTMRRVLLRPLPFIVGRGSHASLVLNFRNISRTHAEFLLQNDKLMLRDLDSTNGTFVNQRQVIHATIVVPGDIIHFAECEFRLVCDQPDAKSGSSSTQDISERVTRGLLSTMKDFNDLLELEAVFPAFQPIVRLDDSSRIAYEVLGRGNFPGLSKLPRELFSVASLIGMEAQLSRLFLRKGIEIAIELGLARSAPLFLNIHPSEVRETPALLAWLREAFQGKRLTAKLEIHEGAVTSVKQMSELRNALTELGLGLVYDDFGSGQARLLELVEVPPDYVKFDISLIQDLHRAAKKRQEMIALLVRIANDMGVKCIAEGVENAEEAEACRQAGFEFGQGFYFDRPFTMDRGSETISDD
jgi:EAL domain-containing protein (putative c-di-GMP-specific phosphodiesterase class I)